MKNCSLFLLALLIPAIGSAQTSGLKNEAGIFAEIGKNTGNYGIRYKTWVKSWMGIHANASYGRQEEDNHGNLKPLYFNDTVLLRNLSTSYKLMNLGIGIDVRKQFYKNLFLYTGMNLTGGYGKGRSDTVGTFYYNNQEFPAFEDQDQNITLQKFYLIWFPTAGIQWNLKHFAIGTDVSIIRNAMTIGSRGGRSTTSFDMEIGNFSQRLYIHYRF